MKEYAQRQGLIVEALDGIETLKANNALNWIQPALGCIYGKNICITN